MDPGFDTVLLDTTLRPNPAMGRTALMAAIGLAAAFNFAFGLAFVLRGAWPVTPFMGADVLLLAWALRATYIAAQAYEQVRLTPLILSVSSHSPRGGDTEETFNPNWVRVDIGAAPQDGRHLFLWSHGRAVQLGSFLSQAERFSFGRTLKAALSRARSFRGG